MIKYKVFKILPNGETMFALSTYAESAQEARMKALQVYEWNKWLTINNTIVMKAR